MLYCTKCQILSRGSCPRCGRSVKKLREARPEDPVYLINCRMLAAGMIEPLLEENSIPYSRSGALGAGLSTLLGNAIELYNIYVPYALYSKAFELISAIFGEDEDIMARLAVYEDPTF